MRLLLLGVLLWAQAGWRGGAQEVPQASGARPSAQFFRYERGVSAGAAEGAAACAILDAAVYAHAAPSLKDLRLYGGGREVPYAITLSGAGGVESEAARVVNLGMRGGRIVFDLEMPRRPYTDVVLELNAHDFIAAAEVTGLGAGAPVGLGTFTLFDLEAQHLSRSATLHLQESSFARLHVELTVSSAPGVARGTFPASVVRGAAVPPSREAQTLFTPVAETASIVQRGKLSVARFTLPAHVPVERVSFVPATQFAGNFSRGVTVTAKAEGGDTAEERVGGEIERVRLAEGGREIRQEQLSVGAVIGANLQADASVEAAIDNGDDAPLPIAAVRLEMRERRLCFPAPVAGERLALSYGDLAVDAPVYDFAQVFSPRLGVASARLGPEEANAGYRPRPVPERTLTERHPELVWVALLGVACVLSVVATHSAKRLPK